MTSIGSLSQNRSTNPRLREQGARGRLLMPGSEIVRL